jgi:hypothetical protein
MSYAPWVAHVVGTVVDGGGEFWALCEGCLFREGPYVDEADADWAALHHREITTDPKDRLVPDA